MNWNETLLPALHKLASRFRDGIRDDLVSEAVVAILSAKARYNSELGEFTPYALRTAFCAMAEFAQTDRVVRVNHSAQWRFKQQDHAHHNFRHRVVRGASAATVPLLEMPGDECEPSVGLEQQEEVDGLRLAMQHLSEQELKIIKLKYADDMSLAGISRQLNIPLKRVRRVMAWAMTSLRRDLLWCQVE